MLCFIQINSAEVSNWNDDNTAFSLIIPIENPFTDFVELPPQFHELHYCGLLCGVIVGALEMVQMKVECRFLKDVLLGHDCNELRVEFTGMLANVMSDEYKEN